MLQRRALIELVPALGALAMTQGLVFTYRANAQLHAPVNLNDQSTMRSQPVGTWITPLYSSYPWRNRNS
jgi:hypothetical protein